MIRSCAAYPRARSWTWCGGTAQPGSTSHRPRRRSAILRLRHRHADAHRVHRPRPQHRGGGTAPRGRPCDLPELPALRDSVLAGNPAVGNSCGPASAVSIRPGMYGRDALGDRRERLRNGGRRAAGGGTTGSSAPATGREAEPGSLRALSGTRGDGKGGRRTPAPALRLPARGSVQRDCFRSAGRAVRHPADPSAGQPPAGAVVAGPSGCRSRGRRRPRHGSRRRGRP